MKNWNRIVIKVGTSTICRPDGTLNLRKIERFARIITDLKNAGKEIVMVTSGAISVGSHKIGWGNRPKDIALNLPLSFNGSALVIFVSPGIS